MTAYIHPNILTREIRHFHLFCGLGGGAKGFNKANPRVGNLQGKFRCIGGIDVNAAAIRDFERLSGSRGTVLDLFDRDQFKDFHGKEPPREWREATAADIRHAAGGEYPHIVFLSAPCKGFSGLLSENRSKTAKYQALNRLTLRGVWLMLEAFQDDLPELIVFENVPRIQNRGRRLLDQIVQLLRRYGYATAETTHDCGELGGLAQSRKRFLLVGRNINKVPDFIYEPEKKSLRSVGDILGRMPLPGHFDGGPMHRVPNLFFKTWLRLAFVEAGKDWRSLNRLNVEDGVLTDYLIVPEQTWRDGALGVHRWDSHAGTVTGRAEATTGRFSVADPRRFDAMHNGILGVHEWADHSGTVTGNSRPMTGAFAVADPRPESKAEYAQYGVMHWGDTSGTVTSQRSPGQGTFSVADPRLSADSSTHKNVFRVVRFDQASGTVTSGHGPSSGGQAVADPRPGWNRHSNNLAVLEWEKPSSTVIAGGKGVQGGQLSIADPRYTNWHPGASSRKLGVTRWDETSGCVIGAQQVASGALAVADPRPGLDRKKGDNYLTAGHYGVVPWDSPAGAVSAAAGHDNGSWSVADPRIPADNERVVARIIAPDNTWHRPFTTLELCALQSLIEPEEYLELDGLSDGDWRERIGNAVPPDAAEAIGEAFGTTLLLVWSGQTYSIGKTPIWVRNSLAALSVAQGDFNVQ
ncbi:TPA: DNA cytosine methyltransferase [Pseudomonas aeruginosa]